MKSSAYFPKIVLCACFLAVLFTGCKAKKDIASGEVNTTLGTKRIIQNHYSNAMDFTTMSGKVKIDYASASAEQGVTVSLRMEKDKAIWVSAPLGLFKALVTPERVSFYNKLEGEYFDGDFDFISNLLGYEMDFQKVQNVLIGNTVLDLRQEKYTSSIEDQGYVLKPKKETDLFKILFSLEPKNFRVKTQQVSQPEKERFLKLDYGYQNVASKVAPSIVKVQASDKDETTLIDLDFRNISFDEKLNFPYKIPKGFKAIAAK